MKKILYADDASSMRKLFQLVLKNDYDLTIVENGAEALEKAHTGTFDLVISDINMPVMSGLEFLKAFRELPQHQFTPILMMTTEASEEMKQQGRELGATGWIVKPFDPEKLKAIIGRACA